jgi:hypothetical protein
VGWPHRWRWREESIQRMVSIAENKATARQKCSQDARKKKLRRLKRLVKHKINKEAGLMTDLGL